MKNMGDGRRVARVEREVQSVVSTYIIQKLQRELPGFVTVGRVQIPADLRNAKVFVSLLQPQVDDSLSVETQNKHQIDALNEALDILQKKAPEIQRYISQQINMKYLPKLVFYADESTEKILKIEKIISTLNTADDPAVKSSLTQVLNSDEDDVE